MKRVKTLVLNLHQKEEKIMSNARMIPQYDTKLFTEIWEDKDTFLADYNNVGIPSTISASSATTLYYLLYARYGNSPIANLDVNQFKYKVFAIIYQYGPAWEKRLAIQTALRGLTEADLLAGSKAIYNTAMNPSTAPSTASLEELDYINSQNTTNYKKSKMDAYSQLWELISTDVTEEFLIRFRKCFKTFVQPEKTWIYVTETEEEDDGE